MIELTSSCDFDMQGVENVHLFVDTCVGTGCAVGIHVDWDIHVVGFLP